MTTRIEDTGSTREEKRISVVHIQIFGGPLRAVDLAITTHAIVLLFIHGRTRINGDLEITAAQSQWISAVTISHRPAEIQVVYITACLSQYALYDGKE
jgi:hypothetical protein